MTTNLCHLTAFCKATADQQRLQVLRVLSRESFGVMELCHILDINQPALSHHLRILADARLVETRRQGTSIYYRRALLNADDPLRALRASLYSTVDDMALAQDQEARKQAIYEQRHGQARQFFKKHADRFQENQNLIAEYRHYAECIDGLLDSEAPGKDSLVVEIGPGESDLLENLARRFKRVIAVDNSPEMLARTRLKLGDRELKNVRLQEGELKDVEGPIDLIILNMVLHHLASPADLFIEASQRLSSRGQLLIADLAPHDQDWTRDACGDLWQGFDAEELQSWAETARLSTGQSVYLGLNNGFQVQVHLFSKNH